MSLFRQSLAALLAACSVLAASAAIAGTVVEFHHRTLDHYFITNIAAEIEALDSGRVAGWTRTGGSFEVFAAGDSRLAGSTPVCRFYGNPGRGIDSHFYSASARECAEVKTRWPEDWRLETEELFRVHLVNPATGSCPAGTKAVYRLWNKRADINHRYTTDPAVIEQMLARGYVLEGDGSTVRPIAFCAADIAGSPAIPAGGTPTCTIAAGSGFPVIGSPVTLSATCTDAPTTYAWTNCTGTGTTCTATSNAAGRATYSLIASNARGAGAPAAFALDWQVAAAGAPSCTMSASSSSVQLGASLTLTAACSNGATQYQWMGCSALVTEACNLLSECSVTSSTCRPVSQQAGSVFYAVIGRNSAGMSTRAGAPVEWTSGVMQPPVTPPTSPTPFCSIDATPSSPAVNSTLTLTASCTNSPTGFAWSGCTSTTNTCTTTESTPVSRSYSVAGRNASGVGQTAQVTVAWQQPPTAPPVCTITPSSITPYVGGTVTLTARCTQSPSSFQWTNCSSTTSTCTASGSAAGPASYGVAGANQFGAGQTVSTTVTWGAPPATGGDFCGQYSDVNRVDLPWGGYIDTHNEGGFSRDGVLVGRIRVPASASGSGGLVSVVEFIDGQARRLMSISPSACDFRGFTPGVGFTVDPQGANHPLGWGAGINPNVFYGITGGPGSGIRLEPGRTYYINIRNVDFDTGQGSCRTANCNVRMTLNTPR